SANVIFGYFLNDEMTLQLITQIPASRRGIAAASMTRRQRSTLKFVGLVSGSGWGLCQCEPQALVISKPTRITLAGFNCATQFKQLNPELPLQPTVPIRSMISLSSGLAQLRKFTPHFGLSRIR